MSDIPDDFTVLDKKQIKQVIEGLISTGKNMDMKSTQNHKFLQKVDKIEQFLQKLYKEKGLTGKENSQKESSNSTKSKKIVKSGREYRKEGIQLDDEYRMKGFWERRKERQEYILQTMNPETPFKTIRAWFRSFSLASGYGYALSEAKRVKETQYIRKEKAAQEALKNVIQKHYSPEKARIEAIKNMNPDELSGKRKAQMEERER